MVRAGEVYYIDEHPLVSQLAERFKSLTATRYALPVNSGTTGIVLSYHACKFGPGDEVLCSTLGYFASATALLMFGATPVFCDVDPRTGNIDPRDAAAKISSRTKGIVVTHLWGHPADMDDLTALAERYSLALIEDASHAHGSTWRGKPVGSFGDIGVFSLGTHKQISGGAAGILVTNDRALYERAMLLGHHPLELAREITEPTLVPFASTALGLNSRPGLIAVALALSHLVKLSELNATKKVNFDYMSELLSETRGVAPMYTDPNAERGAWFGYKLHYNEMELNGCGADVFVKAVRAEGVKMRREPLPPLHTTPTFADEAPPMAIWSDPKMEFRPCQPEDCPHAVAMHARTLTLADKYFHEEARTLVRLYAEAIEKVSKSADTLATLAVESVSLSPAALAGKRVR